MNFVLYSMWMARKTTTPHRQVAVIVWVLLLLAGPAEAQKTLAVIDATSGDDADVAALVGALTEQLDHEAPDSLVAVAAERRAALVGAMPEEDRAAIADVDAAVPRARDALTKFDDKASIAAADAGLARAAGITPTATLTATIADLLFIRGRARLAKDVAGAERDFALVKLLDPSRTLNPVTYLPEVIAAFKRAGSGAASANLEVTAPEGAQVWIDGTVVGPAPAIVTLAVGLHVVTVTGLHLLSQGQLFEVPGTGATLAVAASEASATVITHRLRRQLLAATDEVARADAVAALVRLVGAQAAIVAGREADAVVVWRYTGGGVDALGKAEPTEGISAEELIKPSRPVRIPPPIVCDKGERLVDGVCEKIPIVIPPPPPKPWWRKRWVQATIGGTLLAGVVTTIFAVVTRDPAMVTFEGNTHVNDGTE
jgi:hypothetical protein